MGNKDVPGRRGASRDFRLTKILSVQVWPGSLRGPQGCPSRLVQDHTGWPDHQPWLFICGHATTPHCFLLPLGAHRQGRCRNTESQMEGQAQSWLPTYHVPYFTHAHQTFLQGLKKT